MNPKWSEVLFTRTWRLVLALLGVLLVLDMIGVWLKPMSVITDSTQALLSLPIVSALVVFVLTQLPRLGLYKSASGKNVLQGFVLFFYVLTIFFIFLPALVVLSYLAVFQNIPLVDMQLANADRFFFFDWLSLFDFVQKHKTVNNILINAYGSIGPQMLVVLLFTAIFAPKEHLPEFVSLFVLSSLVAVAIFAVFPAEGAFFYYGKLNTPGALALSDFRLLRTGVLHVVNLDHMQGLVSMPSFHACMAIMFPYALRSNRWLLAWPASSGRFGCNPPDSGR